MSKKKARKNPKNRFAEASQVVEIPRSSHLGPIMELTPMTKGQEAVFTAYEKDYNLVLSGAAGSGKTFIAIGLALKQIAREGFKRQLVIVRSVVPTRDMGFLPGSQEDKEAAYMTPYQSVVCELFKDSMAWKKLIEKEIIRFMTTSFIRGVTIKNSIIIVDESQNCNEHELDSIMTRVGDNSKIIFTGDYYQSDFERDRDRQGIVQFLEIIDRLKYFKHIQFGWEDCVRSPLVRDYLMTKEMIAKEKIKKK